ncbi:MAG: hypothetical protein NVSMB31_02120 [Vulcanimicrobiaceae bacterium]
MVYGMLASAILSHWLARNLPEASAAHPRPIAHRTSVALTPRDYRILGGLVDVRRSSNTTYRGLKINLVVDKKARILYAERSCCALQGWTIATFSSAPPEVRSGKAIPHVEIAGVRLGDSFSEVQRVFGRAGLTGNSLRYEQGPRPGTDPGSHCVTYYTFAMFNGRVRSMDFENAC